MDCCIAPLPTEWRPQQLTLPAQGGTNWSAASNASRTQQNTQKAQAAAAHFQEAVYAPVIWELEVHDPVGGFLWRDVDREHQVQHTDVALVDAAGAACRADRGLSGGVGCDEQRGPRPAAAAAASAALAACGGEQVGCIGGAARLSCSSCAGILCKLDELAASVGPVVGPEGP